MTICGSCEGQVEAATGQCLRCGRVQPRSGPAENDSPIAIQEFLPILAQTKHEHVYPAAENAAVQAGEAPSEEAADAEVPVTEATTLVVAAAAAGVEVAATDGMADAAEGAGAEAVAADAEGPQSADDKETESADTEEAKGLVATYRAKRLTPKRLKFPSKWLIRVTIAQIALVTILMALQKVHQPQVNSAVPGAAGGTFTVPLVVFVVMVISIAAGYWFGLAGALRVRASVGIPIAALATWTLADAPISALRLGGTSIEPQLTDAGLRWAQLGVLGVFWIWLGGMTVARRHAQRKEPVVPPDPDGQPWHPRTFQGALACVLAYYGLEFAIWVLYAQAGQAATGTGSLLEDLGVQAVLLPTFLVLVVLLGSTDLLEWGEIAVRSLVVGTKHKRPLWLLVILTLLVALAIIANVVRLDGIDVLPELAIIGIPAVLLAAFVRLVPGFGGWSGDIRSRAVVTGAIVTFIYITILLSITSAIRSAIGWSAQLDYRFYSLVSVPIALAALTVGLFLLGHGRTGQPEQRGRGLLLVIVGLLIILAALPAFLAAARLPALLPQHHFTLLSGLQAVASLGALGWLISLAVRRRRHEAAGQLPHVLALLAGLQIVSWILDLLNAITKLGADSDYWLAGLFFLTVFWGFATSGDNLTGTAANTAAYPRDGRILLTVSYTLVSTATLLYLGALRAPVGAAAPPGYLTADPVTPLGLAALGSALVIIAFVTKMTYLPAKAGVRPAPAAPVRRAGTAPVRPGGSRIPARSAVQAGIAGVGAVATGAALVVLGSALPQLTRANAALASAPYTAPVPGPGCDAGGALWTVTPGEAITTTCGAGLHVEIGPGPNIEGDVKFLPAYGFASQNYRVSVKIAFSAGFAGCAGIFTRASAAGRYLTVICSDDSVDIDKFGAHGSSPIYLNVIRRAPTYTITAVSRGSDQSVYVDGAKIGTVTDAAFSKTEYIGLGIINSSNGKESAVFSNFSFAPLPASR